MGWQDVVPHNGMLAVGSSDGALGQFKISTSDKHIAWCADNLVIKTKGHASRTSVEQMSDIAQKYRILKNVMTKPLNMYCRDRT